MCPFITRGNCISLLIEPYHGHINIEGLKALSLGLKIPIEASLHLQHGLQTHNKRQLLHLNPELRVNLARLQSNRW